MKERVKTPIIYTILAVLAGVGMVWLAKAQPVIVERKGFVPARSVVIPGSYTKKFAAGDFQVPCALIIGTRKPSTDLKTSLNNALREYDVAV